ncbi:MAG: hypothetical protein IJ853_00330 [Rickettsiales bacterium]|nr:hypothetical protein [Rickettsiales bacterium]
MLRKQQINEEESNVKMEDIFNLLSLVANKVGIDVNEDKNVDITKDRLLNKIESIRNNRAIKEKVFNLIHDRKENGGPGSGIKGHRTIRPVKIDGRRKFKDYKDLSRKAREYYRDKLQGTSIDKQGIGDINFFKRGIDETITKGNPHYIFKIKDIIDKGRVEKPEELYKKRKDTDLPFNVIRSKVDYKGVVNDVLVKIRNKQKGINTKKDFYLIRDDNKKD